MTDRPRPHTPSECRRHHDLVVDFGGPRPEIVCLCGSTRFFAEFRDANMRHTMAGRIVLSIGCDLRSDADLAAAGELGLDPATAKAQMDELHKRKIDIADWVYVLNVGGYVGESTASEIAYAKRLGKPVRYLVDPPPQPPTEMALRNAAAIREALDERSH